MLTKFWKFFTLSRAASDDQKALAGKLSAKVAHQLRMPSVTQEQVLAHALRRGLAALEADPIPGELVALRPSQVLTAKRGR